jgi:hypothetical protein
MVGQALVSTRLAEDKKMLKFFLHILTLILVLPAVLQPALPVCSSQIPQAIVQTKTLSFCILRLDRLFLIEILGSKDCFM